MLFQATHSPTGYGKVVDRSITRLEASQLKFVTRLEEGLLALEIQKGIYSFLVSIAKLILHDIAPSDFFLAPHQPLPTMPRPKRPEKWDSLSAHALEVPYRIPQRPDLQRLETLVKGRRSSDEDHVWLLREDPIYFWDTLREWSEHNGDTTSAKCTCRSFWTRHAGRMITHAFVALVFWDDIHKKLKELPPIEQQMKSANDTKV